MLAGAARVLAACGGRARLPVPRARAAARDGRRAGRVARRDGEPVALGVALTALTVCFLWLERLPLRPASDRGDAGARARGRAPARRRGRPRGPVVRLQGVRRGARAGRAARASTGATATGRSPWPRDGAEVLRVAARRPSYWKVADLDDFDGETWIDRRRRRRQRVPELDLAPTGSAAPALARRRSASRCAGSRRRVDRRGHDARASRTRRVWSSRPGEAGRGARDPVPRRRLLHGQGYVPRPTPGQLADSTSGSTAAASTSTSIPTRAARCRSGRGRRRAGGAGTPCALRARAGSASRRSPNGRGPEPYASYQTLVRSNDGDRALRQLRYARTWALAQAADARGRDAVRVRRGRRPLPGRVRLQRLSRPPIAPGRAPLDAFLFDTQGAATASTSRARWRCCCAWAASPRGSPPASRPAATPSARARGSCATPTPTPGSRRGSTTSAGSRSTRPRRDLARSQIAALDRPPETSGDAATRPTGAAARRAHRRRPPGPARRAGGPGGAGAAPAPREPGRRGGGSRSAASPSRLLGAWRGAARWRRRAGPARARPRGRRARGGAAAGRPPRGGDDAAAARADLGRSPEAAAYLRALRAGRYATTTAPGRRRAAAGRCAASWGAGAGPRGGCARPLGAAAVALAPGVRAPARPATRSGRRRAARRSSSPGSSCAGRGARASRARLRSEPRRGAHDGPMAITATIASQPSETVDEVAVAQLRDRVLVLDRAGGEAAEEAGGDPAPAATTRAAAPRARGLRVVVAGAPHVVDDLLRAPEVQDRHEPAADGPAMPPAADAQGDDVGVDTRPAAP